MTNVQIVNSFMDILNGLEPEDRAGILLSMAGIYHAEKQINGEETAAIAEGIRRKSDEICRGIEQKIVRVHDICAQDRSGRSTNAGIDPRLQLKANLSA